MTGVDPEFPFLDTENPADARLLNGNYRPELDGYENKKCRSPKTTANPLIGRRIT